MKTKRKKRGPYLVVPFEEKKRFIIEHIENGVSLLKLGATTGISSRSIRNWCDYVQQYGMTAFEEKYASGTYSMGRPKKKTYEEMTELEKLRYENAYLKAENALLKKVKALVEEREASIRKTGSKPSKN